MAAPISTPSRDVAFRRAALPEILLSGTGDLPAALGVATESAARRILRREGIPHSQLGRRICVRRLALLAWLEAREVSPMRLVGGVGGDA